MSILPTKLVDSTPDDSGEFAFDDEGFSSEYPTLFEFLSRIMVQGSPRQPSALLVTVEPRRVQLCLMDRHSAQVTFHASESLSEALTGLEERAARGKLDWRKDKKQAWRNNRH